MPLISDLQINKEKKFEKKAYRPWDQVLPSPNETNLPENSKEILEGKILNLEKELRDLYGAQKIIILHFLKQINETTDSYAITKNLSINELIIECNIPENTIRGTLQKLKNKYLLATHEKKPGRGGYARYKFAKSVYDFLVQNLPNIL